MQPVLTRDVGHHGERLFEMSRALSREAERREIQRGRREKRCPSHGGPTVRIPLPPAESRMRT